MKLHIMYRGTANAKKLGMIGNSSEIDTCCKQRGKKTTNGTSQPHLKF
jgi:hypothetical protein